VTGLHSAAPADGCPAATAGGEVASRTKVSVGIFAYNEEPLIERVLDAFLAQRLDSTEIVEIAVDTSGSTDRTTEIASAAAERSPLVRVRDGGRREGKAAAIGRFVAAAGGDALVIASGDTVAAPDVVERLVHALARDPACGMAGPRPIPRRVEHGLVAGMNTVLWELHHRVSLRSPKLSEVVAVRRTSIGELSTLAYCDEVVLEAAVRRSGGHLRYVPEATVENFGPQTLRAFYNQRRRIHCQHLGASRLLGYAPATFRLARVFPEVIRHARREPTSTRTLLALGTLELVARAHGFVDFRRGRDYRRWSPVPRPRLDD
jgi:cellulose synthase/poly-beta-1,6-N-acetylglucosamine synthase-like glycosyltransferase